MQLFLTNTTTACSFLVDCMESVGYSCASIFDALKNGALTIVEPISGNPEPLSQACATYLNYNKIYAITISRFDGFASWEACSPFIDWLTQQAQQVCDVEEIAAQKIRDARDDIYITLIASFIIMVAAYCTCCCYGHSTDDKNRNVMHCFGLFRSSPKPQSPEYDDGQKYICGRRLY